MTYTPEIVKEIIDNISKGATNLDAATMAGICEDTFYAWQKEHAEFSEQIKKAKAVRKTAMVNKVLTAARQSWQAAAWYLERTEPAEFARRDRQMEVKSDGKIEVVFHDYE
jgi:hypothetical protein